MQPNLIERTNEAIGKAGMIGEAHNRLLMYIIFTSRKRESPLHIISFGSSGAGKSHLQEKVAELIPQEDKIESTSLTINALYYFGEYDLQHKLILIEMVPLKDTKRVTRTITFKVKGPVTLQDVTHRKGFMKTMQTAAFSLILMKARHRMKI